MPYTTKDIYLSGFLISEHVPLLAYERANGTTTFSFPDSPELLAMVQSYYADKILVSPIKYGNAMKNLKNLIHITTNTKNDNNMYNNTRIS